MGAATGRATGGGEEVVASVDSRCQQRGAFSLVVGELVRVALVYASYTQCMAGLIDLSFELRLVTSVLFCFSPQVIMVHAYSRLWLQLYLQRSSHYC